MDAAYKLSRKFGEPINICWRVTSAVDRPTGLKMTTLGSRMVAKAVVLQQTVDRQFVYNLTWIASNKNFTYGALFDAQQRSVLIRRKDIPDLTIEPGYYVVMESKRYEVESAESYADWWNLACKQVTGVPVENAINKSIYQELYLVDGVAYDKS